MASSINRRSSLSNPITMLFKSSNFGCNTWRRLNANNCRTSVLARSEASSIRSTSLQLRRNLWTIQRQFGVALNDRQQVIEIVRDSARQAADRLHPARLL